MYSRNIDGQVYTFGVSGKLIQNVLVMFDRETESLWSQLLGEAVEGGLKGTKLTFVPAWLMTWEEWKGRYPHTLALVKGYAGDSDPYGGYYESPQTGVLGEARSDDHLPAKQFVTGVALGGEAVAYPWSELSREPVVNDQIGDTPVLVVFAADAPAGAVFRRTLAGQTLSFSLSDPEALSLTDAETGSRWAGMTGEALEGPLAGQKLDPLKNTASFWFGWKDWYPETRVYGQEE